MPKKKEEKKKKTDKVTKKKKEEKRKIVKKKKKEKDKKETKKTEKQELKGEELIEKTDGKEDSQKEKYFEAVGRRKESVARVRLYTKKSTDVFPENKGLILVNQKPYYEYFKDEYFQYLIELPLRKLKSLTRFKSTILVRGGGLTGQADAIKHGLTKALVLFDKNYRKKLRKAGLLTQDSRIKERRKYGLKKARRAPQWSKR